MTCTPRCVLSRALTGPAACEVLVTVDLPCQSPGTIGSSHCRSSGSKATHFTRQGTKALPCLADCTAGKRASAASPHEPEDHCNCPHMLLCRKLWQQVTQVNRGQRLGDANSMPLSDCTVEDLLRIVRALPAEESAVKAVSQGLQYLDSRAVAALLKVSFCPLPSGSSSMTQVSRGAGPHRL